MHILFIEWKEEYRLCLLWLETRGTTLLCGIIIQISHFVANFLTDVIDRRHRQTSSQEMTVRRFGFEEELEGLVRLWSLKTNHAYEQNVYASTC